MQTHVRADTFAQALRRDGSSDVNAVSWQKLSGSFASSLLYLKGRVRGAQDSRAS